MLSGQFFYLYYNFGFFLDRDLKVQWTVPFSSPLFLLAKIQKLKDFNNESDTKRGWKLFYKKKY